jgi:hypothetical protein
VHLGFGDTTIQTRSRRRTDRSVDWPLPPDQRVHVEGPSATAGYTLGVLGGTGKFASATETGIFTGSRQAALGTTVAATFDLTIAGAD